MTLENKFILKVYFRILKRNSETLFFTSVKFWQENRKKEWRKVL